MRKIVQIAAAGEGPYTNATLYALCADGTVWSLAIRSGGIVWHAEPPIPEGNPKFTAPFRPVTIQDGEVVDA